VLVDNNRRKVVTADTTKTLTSRIVEAATSDDCILLVNITNEYEKVCHLFVFVILNSFIHIHRSTPAVHYSTRMNACPTRSVYVCGSVYMINVHVYWMLYCVHRFVRVCDIIHSFISHQAKMNKHNVQYNCYLHVYQCCNVVSMY
jgi:hypothetical protein